MNIATLIACLLANGGDMTPQEVRDIIESYGFALQTNLDAANNKLGGLTSRMDAAELDIGTKANQADLTQTNTNLSNLAITVGSKANQADLDSLKSRVATIDTRSNTTWEKVFLQGLGAMTTQNVRGSDTDSKPISLAGQNYIGIVRSNTAGQIKLTWSFTHNGVIADTNSGTIGTSTRLKLVEATWDDPTTFDRTFVPTELLSAIRSQWDVDGYQEVDTTGIPRRTTAQNVDVTCGATFLYLRPSTWYFVIGGTSLSFGGYDAEQPSTLTTTTLRVE